MNLIKIRIKKVISTQISTQNNKKNSKPIQKKKKNLPQEMDSFQS